MGAWLHLDITDAIEPPSRRDPAGTEAFFARTEAELEAKNRAPLFWRLMFHPDDGGPESDGGHGDPWYITTRATALDRLSTVRPTLAGADDGFLVELFDAWVAALGRCTAANVMLRGDLLVEGLGGWEVLAPTSEQIGEDLRWVDAATPTAAVAACTADAVAGAQVCSDHAPAARLEFQPADPLGRPARGDVTGCPSGSPNVRRGCRGVGRGGRR